MAESLAGRLSFAVAVSGISSSRKQSAGANYCVKILYATISATIQAKISSAGSDFRIIGPLAWRTADRLG